LAGFASNGKIAVSERKTAKGKTNISTLSFIYQQPQDKKEPED